VATGIRASSGADGRGLSGDVFADQSISTDTSALGLVGAFECLAEIIAHVVTL